MNRLFAVLTAAALALLSPVAAFAAGLTGTFANIDGGSHSIESWRGRPVLVVNTASQCGFTGQYDNLQAVYDRYRDRGLVVLAVPSDDFNQELSTAAEVKEFCALNFALDLPMTDITHVRGAQAHEFFRQVKAVSGFEPSWNFNKVLLTPDGEVAGTWGSMTKPDAPAITRKIEAMLN
jgi:glutathione peroxidase